MLTAFSEFAYGVLHWSPTDFWCSTPWDIYRAMAGWRRVNGLDKRKKKQLTADDAERLKQWALMEREMEKKRNG